MIINKITLSVFLILAIICSYMQSICKFSEPGKGGRGLAAKGMKRGKTGKQGANAAPPKERPKKQVKICFMMLGAVKFS